MIELSLSANLGFPILEMLSRLNFGVLTWNQNFESRRMTLYLTPEQVNTVRDSTHSLTVKRMLGTFSEEAE